MDKTIDEIEQENLWAKWGRQDGAIGFLPNFECIEQKYSRIYWNNFWDAFIITQTCR